MTIETKYNIGQEVFYMKDNKVHSFTISQINIFINVIREEMLTMVDYGTFGICKTECELFSSKEELLKSL